MSERHTDTLEYFIAPQSSGQCDGTLDRPFPSLDEALKAIRQNGDSSVSNEGVPGKRTVEIVLIDRPGGRFRPGRKPRYQFYVDERAASDGDGTELAPWPSFGAAMQT